MYMCNMVMMVRKLALIATRVYVHVIIMVMMVRKLPSIGTDVHIHVIWYWNYPQ